eukprot:SAG22_NODE_205_length_15308_cov_20.539023_2_plen_91_part_00
MPELATANFANFCPAQCAGSELVSRKALPFCCASTVYLAKAVPFRAVPLPQAHWNTQAALKALIANRYQPCAFAKVIGVTPLFPSLPHSH